MNARWKKALGLHRPRLALSVIAAMLALGYLFPHYAIATGSMEPTIRKGDHVVAFRGWFLLGAPRKGDIVVFEPVDGISQYPWVHRVMATAGQKFRPPHRPGRRDGDGLPDRAGPAVMSEEMIVPEGFVYQSGDAPGSFHGLARTSQIRGRVLFHFALPWR
jgi:signal peptidase I